MKKLVLPIILLLSVANAHAWFWVKPTTPATTETTATEGATAEAQETMPEVETSTEATEEESTLGLSQSAIKTLGARLGSFGNELKFANALRTGDVEQIKEIIDQVDVNAPIKPGFALTKKAPIVILFESEAPNKVAIAELLVAKGADKNKLKAIGQRLVSFAREDKDQDVIQWLKANGIIASPLSAGMKKPAAAAPRVQEVKVEIIPVSKPAAIQKPLLVPTRKPAPAQTPVIEPAVTASVAQPVKSILVAPTPATTKQWPSVPAPILAPVEPAVTAPAPAKAKWPSAPAPERPVQQVPVSILEEQAVPPSRPIEEMDVMVAR